MTMSAVEIQIAGFGGQGIVLAGMTIGRGLVIYEDSHVSLTQSFGPEARGSACSVQLMVSREPVLYPYLSRPDILVTMSQDAYRKFSPGLKEGGTLIFEEDLVRPATPDEELERRYRVYRVPATRLAEELGRKMVMNIVLVGFFVAVTGLMKAESAREAIRESVPPGTESLNLAAFEKGYAYGLKQLEDKPVAAVS
jgi:2-oxoglutarate ferredoxin oxidoreductase subunit gamma